MQTTREPQPTNQKETKMDTQTDVERKTKRKSIVMIWGTAILLAGGVVLAGNYLDNSEVQGPAFLFLCALGFSGVVLWSPKSWWAIIPAGVFASLGLSAVLESLIPHEEYPSLPNTLGWDVYIWVLFLGFAATFGVLWLLRKSQPTGWAKHPAIGLLALAVLAFILGSQFQEVWMATVILVTGGTLMLALFTGVAMRRIRREEF
jgi:hypothetical protein